MPDRAGIGAGVAAFELLLPPQAAKRSEPTMTTRAGRERVRVRFDMGETFPQETSTPVIKRYSEHGTLRVTTLLGVQGGI